MGAVWISSFCVQSTEAKQRGNRPGILQPAETLLFSFLSLLQPACKTGPWPSNAPSSPSLSHLSNQSHICGLATWLGSEASLAGRRRGGERERDATTAAGTIQMSCALPVLPDLSERSSFKVSGRETEGWLAPLTSFSWTECYISERSNLASRDSLTAWEIPSSFKALIGG